MELTEYQRRAALTDQHSKKGEAKGMMVALLGLAGETGSLLTLYKKWLRDGDAFQIMKDCLSEELGDILWYVATIATHAGINMEDVAAANVEKTAKRWLPSASDGLYDDGLDSNEQLPRSFVAEFRNSDGLDPKLEVYIDGEKCGSALTDNAYEADDYRYHDLLHLSFATFLGWSPVFRALLRRKRKSNPLIDEVEDGGRAVAVEEGLSALIFSYARAHSLLRGVSRVDWPLLRTCHDMTSHLEVSNRRPHDWERAILTAFEIWRKMKARNGGVIRCNLRDREMLFDDSPENSKDN